MFFFSYFDAGGICDGVFNCRAFFRDPLDLVDCSVQVDALFPLRVSGSKHIKLVHDVALRVGPAGFSAALLEDFQVEPIQAVLFDQLINFLGGAGIASPVAFFLFLSTSSIPGVISFLTDVLLSGK